MFILLKANDLYSDTKGMTLGYNEDAELITLQNKYDFNKINQDKFDELVLNIMSEGVEQMGRLDPHKIETNLNEENSQQNASKTSDLPSSNWLSL